jgi:Mg-chelatase subunit ChlD
MADHISNPPTSDELLARIAELERRLHVTAPAGPNHADIWFLLDRSGSMQSIADDVVGGFDTFFAEQRKIAGTATVTLVQFDGQDPHEVLVDGRPIEHVRSIAGRFVPRGNTPLYDAIGQLLARAERHVLAGGDPADQLAVILTDGHENASREFTAEQVNARIGGLRKTGWTFVFLGANQDSYDTGSRLAMAAGSTANFAASPAGVAASYGGLSRAVGEFRRKGRAQRVAEEGEFWGGTKESEQVR